MKHVTTSANNDVSVKDNTIDIENDLHLKDTLITTTTPNPTTKVNKKNFQECCYEVFVQLAENSLVVIKNFEITKTLLEKVDRKMDRFIDKF